MSAAQAFDRIKHTPYGFATRDQVAALAADPELRLTLFLVRCGRCRFLAAAQDVGFLIEAIEAAGDYVRDVSLPAEVRKWS